MKYYLANSMNQPEGPFSVDELRARGITPDSLVYNEQLGNWTAAAQVPELNAYLFGGAQSATSTPNGGYQSCNAMPQQPSYGYQQPQQPMIAPKTWLVESILVTLFCCLPFGIVGIIKASSVESLFRSGNYDAAQQASNDAGKWTKWGFFCGIGVIVLYFLFWIVLGVGAALV